MTTTVNANYSIVGFLDLNGNEIKNTRLHNQTGDPGVAAVGYAYYNTSTGKVRVCTNATGPVFVDVGPGNNGDLSSNTITTSIGEFALFSTTAGKTLERGRDVLTTNGVVKSTNGVAAIAQPGTDYSAGTQANATGIVKSTTSTGTLSTAIASDFPTLNQNTTGTAANVTGTVAIANGGTGVTTLGSYALKGNGTSAIAQATLADLGSTTADFPMANHKLTGLADGTAAQDAVTKFQLDSAVAGVFYKTAVKVASTAPATLTTAFANGQTLDGVALVTGDRILIKDQTAAEVDGIYTVNVSGAPTRATDADLAAEITTGATVFVDQGTTQGNSQWTQTNPLVTIGVTTQLWAKTYQAVDLTASGVPKKYSVQFGDNTALTFTINHGLGLAIPHACHVDVTLESTGAVEICDVVKTDANNVQVSGWTTATKPGVNAYRCTVIG